MSANLLTKNSADFDSALAEHLRCQACWTCVTPMTAHDRLLPCDSYTRTSELCSVMAAEPDARARVVHFLEWWNMCDAPWPYRSQLASLLRDALRPPNSLRAILPAWFDGLPSIVPIYRGCERGRERGLSWTSDLQVAQKFAKGKRCINRHPTLVSACIPKEHVFAVFIDREEHEVVADYRRLRRLKIEPAPALR